MLTLLNEARTDYEVVNVLDDLHNPGLRETIKTYSQWPTIPQVRFCGLIQKPAAVSCCRAKFAVLSVDAHLLVSLVETVDSGCPLPYPSKQSASSYCMCCRTAVLSAGM